MSSLPIVDKCLQWVVVSTVSPAKLYADKNLVELYCVTSCGKDWSGWNLKGHKLCQIDKNSWLTCSIFADLDHLSEGLSNGEAPTLVASCCWKTKELQSEQGYGKQRTHKSICKSKRRKKSVAMATLVARCCQKANQLESVQEYGKQRTHKNIYMSKKQKKNCHDNTCCQASLKSWSAPIHAVVWSVKNTEKDF